MLQNFQHFYCLYKTFVHVNLLEREEMRDDIFQPTAWRKDPNNFLEILMLGYESK